MARLRNVSSGAIVSVTDEKAARLGSEWEPFDGTLPVDDGEKSYAAKTAKELKAEIAERNVDREDDAKLSDKGNKAALVAVLEQDDADQLADEDLDGDEEEDEGDEPDSDDSTSDED